MARRPKTKGIAGVGTTRGVPRGSLQELVDFFDNNDMGDYLETMLEAHFDVDELAEDLPPGLPFPPGRID